MTENERLRDIIILVSTDNKKFEISKRVASVSTKIGDMIDLGYCEDGSGIPTNVKGDTLLKIIEYMKHPSTSTKFFEMPKSEIFEFLLGANYLEISSLRVSLCKKLANMIITGEIKLT